MENDNRKYYAHTKKKEDKVCKSLAFIITTRLPERMPGRQRKYERKSTDEAILTKCLHMKRML